MNARKRLQHVLARKDRQKRGLNADDTETACAQLRYLLDQLGAEDSRVKDFVPIRLVTLLEVFIRNWIAVLVDVGGEYEVRAEKLVKFVKFDYLLTSALRNREVSLGEVAANEISLNSLDEVVSVFDTLLDESFLKVVSSAAEETLEGTSTPIVADVESTKAVVGRIFAVRHIVVHEWPSKPPYTDSEMRTFVDVVEEFMAAVDHGLHAKLWWNDTYKVQDHLLIARSDVVTTQAKLDALIMEVKAVFDQVDELRKAQDYWQKFADAETACHRAIYDPSVAEVLGLVHKNAMIESRIEDLQSLLDDYGKMAPEAALRT